MSNKKSILTICPHLIDITRRQVLSIHPIYIYTDMYNILIYIVYRYQIIYILHRYIIYIYINWI